VTDRPPSDTNRRYDLFVSYSETARELRIAKALTAALEQIVERARRRDPSRGRSILVYRDERNLAARDLWDQLYQALDESSALVILLSRRAARSPGVGAEIAHWRTLVHAEDPPRRRTHLVFTDSRWLWEAGSHRFVAPEPGPSVSTPPGELADLFPREPKVVDLTWVRRRRDLSIRNQRFHNEVVVLASAVSGIPVDVLRADDRWERRARRTQLIRRWIAGVLVVAALLAAVGRYGYVQTRAERDRRTVDRLLVTSQDAATDPRLALLLAVEAAARRPGADSSENLLALLAGLRFRGALPGTHRNPNAIAVSPGGLVVVGSTTPPSTCGSSVPTARPVCWRPGRTRSPTSSRSRCRRPPTGWSWPATTANSCPGTSATPATRGSSPPDRSGGPRGCGACGSTPAAGCTPVATTVSSDPGRSIAGAFSGRSRRSSRGRRRSTRCACDRATRNC
jgi:hypothetical protein